MCIFCQGGWMAKILVESPINLEFPVLSNGFVYVVKSVKNLSKEASLKRLFESDDVAYIWY